LKHKRLYKNQFNSLL